jgi:hypothetical protein
MSYEGYNQHICRNGHRFDEPEQYGEGDIPKCPECDAVTVWENGVDQTNCEDHGKISNDDFYKLLKTPATYRVCPTCHTSEIVTPDIYEIPTNEWRKRHQQYWDSLKDRHVYIDRHD